MSADYYATPKPVLHGRRRDQQDSKTAGAVFKDMQMGLRYGRNWKMQYRQSILYRTTA